MQDTDNTLTGGAAAPRSGPLPFKVRQLTTIDDPGVPGFIKLYQEAFAGPPYFEAYDYDYVLNNVVIPHIPHLIVIAEVNGSVVGFICAHPVISDINPEVRNFLTSQPAALIPFDLAMSLHISELGSSSEVRRLGLGGQLMMTAYKWGYDNGYPYYVAKTAETGSNSKRLIEKFGGILLPFVQEVCQEDIKSASDRRIWFYGKTSAWADFDSKLTSERKAPACKQPSRGRLPAFLKRCCPSLLSRWFRWLRSILVGR